MPKLTDLLTNLAKKAGLTIDEDFQTLLSNEALSAIEVNDKVASGIDNALISLKDAKNNHPEIKNFYQKQALDTIDTNIEALMDDLGMDDALRNEILGERSTYKRVPMLVKKIRDLESKKANTTNQTDKVSLQNQIDQLQAQLRTKAAEHQALESKFNDKLKQYKIQYKLDQMLGRYSTIYDNPQAPLDPEVKLETLRNLIARRMQMDGLKFEFDDAERFAIMRNDGGNYYGDNNQQVSPEQFAERVLSENKLLLVTPAQNGAAGANQKPGNTNPFQAQAAQAQPAGGQGGAQQGNPTLTALVNESLKSLDQSNAAPVM